MDDTLDVKEMRRSPDHPRLALHVGMGEDEAIYPVHYRVCDIFLILVFEYFHKFKEILRNWIRGVKV